MKEKAYKYFINGTYRSLYAVIMIAVYFFLPHIIMPSSLSGLWYYGIYRTGDYAVIITEKKGTVFADYVIRDEKSGASYIYAKAKGRYLSFWELELKGEHIKSHQRTKKGQKFRARWLLFDNDRKIQEISYWGVYRIVSYLSR